MTKGKKGCVVSAVLYPLLVLFLAIIMGLLSMTDTRKRILDKMKLEITDNIFDDAACSCDTILAKLNYIIANGTGGSGGDNGSYAYNKLTLNVKTYEAYSDFPVVGNIIGDIAVLSDTPIKNYYVSTSVPKSPQEGTVWIVQDNTSNYYVTSDWNRIGISYVMQYENSKWVLKKSYVYNGESWTMLYYVNLKNGYVDLTGTDINAEITKTYDYTGEYQTFKAVFSGYYKIELWGAQGASYNASNQGGFGSYTSGDVYLNAGETLYVYIGGQGTNPSGTGSTYSKGTGGWNGGGNGARMNSSYSNFAGGGGGATDIRLKPALTKTEWSNEDSLKTRIMVAAGGSGAIGWNGNYSGGSAGGGLIGYDGKCNNGTCSISSNENYGGIGGTQSYPGYSPYSKTTTIGGFGYGGNAATTNTSGSGGGGGYYGGGGAATTGNDRTTGGGGSSYISGFNGCNSIENNNDNILIHNGSSVHYKLYDITSNNYRYYYFKNTKMIDGIGYSWNNYGTLDIEKQPSFNGNDTQIGNVGNGHAKISLQTVEYKSNTEIENEINTVEYHYDYSNSYQIFNPKKSGYYKIELWGAQGASYNASNQGGLGSYTSGDVYLNAGETLYVYIGGQGTNPSGTGSTYSKGTGGWNGGGNGARMNSSYSNFAGGGGGATDIRLEKGGDLADWSSFESSKSRIMVAAGGSGAISWNGNYSGGSAGGGLIGYDGKCDNGTCSISSNENYGGIGGTQSYPGYSPYSKTTTIGGFGYGGNAATTNNSGSGGGGGYYGGGGGSSDGKGRTTGGGGSSYISGFSGTNSLTEISTPGGLIFNGSSYHYSGYYFINTQMIDGEGYSWGEATIKNSILQPSHKSKNTQVGNTGNGYAKITMVKEENKTSEEIKKIMTSLELKWHFIYSGQYQIFTAPKSGIYQAELWGASGGNGSNKTAGGLGSYTSGKIYLDSGEKVYIYVGGQGANPPGIGKNYTSGTGGWNGGGDGARMNSSYSNTGAGGGGATDIRLVSGTIYNDWSSIESLKSRIMVAAGGSGAIGWNGTYSSGSAGGGLIGYDGKCDNEVCSYKSHENYGGIGGTQSYPGYSPFSKTTTIGGFGYGGNAATTNNSGSGGGGGYYGGGGGSSDGKGRTTGGGGSSYISGFNGTDSISELTTQTDILHTGSAYHYSNYYFDDTQIIDGDGNSWLGTKKISSIQQPTYDSTSTQLGNYGNGYAKITFISEDKKTKEELENELLTNERVWSYSYSETYQILEIKKTGNYKMELWGAGGGSSYSSSLGGLGGYTKGEINLVKGTKLYIYVGETGKTPLTTGKDGAANTGGFNGGGDGARMNSSYSNAGAGGGGATDIRTEIGQTKADWSSLKSLKTRIMVAAGGSGSVGWNGTYSSGSAAGGLIGYDGLCDNNKCTNYNGTGATQLNAGLSNSATSTTKGGFGYGGNAATADNSGSGGGGGWYGGGGAATTGKSRTTGGGGSSYISGHEGCIGVNSSGNSITSKYSKLEDSISYTGYKFTNTKMIDGKGYSWNISVGTTIINQPTPDGASTQTGQSGNGYAKITYLGA